MLEETKKIYEECANLYAENWKTLNKNDLIRIAIKHKNTTKYDSYISAIMLRYWAKMNVYCQRCKLVATPEDVHMWMTQAVLYAVTKHPWTNPNSSIFEDPNGPDKVINRVFESKRLTFYQQLNRYNRKINGGILSLDSLSEETLDTYTPSCEDEHTFIINDLIVRAFEEKDYFFSFLVDAIVTERLKVGGRHKQLVTHLKNLETHCDIFSGRYDIVLEKVERAATYITRMNRSTLIRKINYTLADMRRKIKLEQQEKIEDKKEFSTLYTANQIVEYYYTELWDNYDGGEF